MIMVLGLLRRSAMFLNRNTGVEVCTCNLLIHVCMPSSIGLHRPAKLRIHAIVDRFPRESRLRRIDTQRRKPQCVDPGGPVALALVTL